MAKKTKPEAVEAAPEALVLDVTGQPGGPSPEEQARVDAEQFVLMAALKKARDEAEAGERANHEAKLERARVAVQQRIDRDAEMERRLKVIEEKLGIV